MRDAAPQGTYKVQALDRAFAVLDLLGESETPLGLAQVAAHCSCTRARRTAFSWFWSGIAWWSGP